MNSLRRAIRRTVSPTRAWSYRCVGRDEDALAAFRRAFALSQRMVGIRSRIGSTLLSLGRLDEALAEAEKEPTETLKLLTVATIRHAMGDKAGLDAALAKTIEKYEVECAYDIARVLAYRGAADRAFEWLEKAIQFKDPGLAGIAREQDFDRIGKGRLRYLLSKG